MEKKNVKGHIRLVSIKKTIVGITFFVAILGMAACSLRNHHEISETGAFNSMTTYCGDYCIEINAKEPGHPEDESIFATYYDWYDTPDYKTDVGVAFYFYTNSISEDYAKLENEVVIDGKTCYYIPESNTKVILLYVQDEAAYLKMELSALARFDMSTGKSADLNIILEDILVSDDFKNAFTFTVLKSED